MHFAYSHVEMDTRQDTGNLLKDKLFSALSKAACCFPEIRFYIHIYSLQYFQSKLYTVDKKRKDVEEHIALLNLQRTVVCLQTRLWGRAVRITVFDFFLFDFFPKNTSMLVITRYNPWQTVNSLILSEICWPAKSPQEQFWQKPPVLTASLPPSGLPHLYTPLYRHRAGKREKVKHFLESRVHTSLSLDKQLLPTQTFTYYFLLVKPTEQWWRKIKYWRANPLF